MNRKFHNPAPPAVRIHLPATLPSPRRNIAARISRNCNNRSYLLQGIGTDFGGARTGQIAARIQF